MDRWIWDWLLQIGVVEGRRSWVQGRETVSTDGLLA